MWTSLAEAVQVLLSLLCGRGICAVLSAGRRNWGRWQVNALHHNLQTTVRLAS